MPQSWPKRHASGLAYAAKIVPHEIDDHHVLGAVFFARQQFGLCGGGDGRVARAGPCAFDRPRFDLAIRNAKESFGRGADDLEIACASK